MRRSGPYRHSCLDKPVQPSPEEHHQGDTIMTAPILTASHLVAAAIDAFSQALVLLIG